LTFDIRKVKYLTATATMMTRTTIILLVASISLGSAHTNELVSDDAIKNMEHIFLRSDTAHKEAMVAIMQSMSPAKALQILEKNNLTTPALMQAVASGKQASLRKQPKGYSGLEGAKNLLNDMIYESMSKYDAEIAKCTEYYSKQCAAMEVCRGKISAANYVAANSRALILDQQATINRCEVDIPTRKLELKQHLLKCKHELSKLNVRLKIVMGDIAVMTTILEMTDCEKQSFLQRQKLALMRCEESCSKNGNSGSTNKTFVTFSDEELRKKVSQLQSSVSHGLLQNSFADLFEGLESLESAEVKQTPLVNKTEFNNPPVPVTKVPGKPGPYPKQWISKCGCHIGKSPMCYKLQGRFLLIQAGIQDERDNLLEEIAELETACEETKQTLETDIANDEDMLSQAQTKLAAATEKEATAGETARQTATENEQLNNDLVKQMKTCSGNYINFETEICALKKIRGELYKMKGGSGGSAFFQDCEVAKWSPEECTKKCAGGEQKLTRSVMTHPNGGAKCLPLAAMRSCNDQPCPVDCKLSTWSGWSKCSADCGGGVSQRLREVKRAMKYGGAPCGETSEAKSCNAQACEKDCDLSPWTKWSTCSKDCDGGTKKRQKFIKAEAEGAGKCADEWSLKRLQYAKCNMKRCALEPGQEVLTCNRTLDVVLLIDGSASMGKQGWAAEIKAARNFVDAFSAPGAKTNIAVILFSGPRTWSGVEKCTSKSKKKVDQAKVCGIQTVSHFTKDLKKVKNLITGLEFPKGGALVSLALLTAKAELALGRKNAESNVIVFTAGRPLSYRKTGMASSLLRKAARLVWIPVSQNAPLKYIKKWATRRWEENIVSVKKFSELAKPALITHIVANICPKKKQKLKFGRKSGGLD
jgi:hypothetical protein